jgi:aromatic-L-amino-acid decarboxylase
LREQGVEGIQARLRRDLENARWLDEQVRREPHWRVVAPVHLQTVCVRHEPPGMSPDETDAHNLEWVERLNRSGAAYLTPSTLKGRRMVRISVGSELTERGHVERLWDAIRASSAPPEAG